MLSGFQIDLAVMQSKASRGRHIVCSARELDESLQPIFKAGINDCGDIRLCFPKISFDHNVFPLFYQTVTNSVNGSLICMLSAAVSAQYRFSCRTTCFNQICEEQKKKIFSFLSAKKFATPSISPA